MRYWKDKDNPNLIHMKIEHQDDVDIHVENNEVEIIRYLNLNKLYSMLISKEIRFSRLDKFSDEYEGLAVVDGMPESADYFRKRICASCWNRYKAESFALWKIYLGGDQAGVAIKSKVGYFMDSIKDKEVKNRIIPGRVFYVEHYKRFDLINSWVLASRKKDFYEYEQEVRFIYESNGSQEQPEGVMVGIQPEVMIEEIILSPYMPEWIESTMKSIISEFGYKGLLPKIKMSKVKDVLLK